MNEKQRNIVCLKEKPAFLRFLRTETNSNSNNLIATTYQLNKKALNSIYGSIYVLSHNLSIKQRVETNGGVFRFEVLIINLT